MPRRNYGPSGLSDPGALPIVTGAALGVAIVGGALEAFVSQWFSLLIIFPLGLGLLVGGVGMALVSSKRIRRPLAVGAIGLVAAIAAQGTVHFVSYQQARSRLATALEQDPALAPFIREHGSDAAVDAALTGAGGSPFLGYMRIAAEQGITITRTGSSGKGPTLTGLAAKGLWVAEILIVAACACWMMVGQAREPFCEPCNGWYTTEEALASGAGDKAALKATLSRLENGQIGEAIRSLGTSNGKTAATLVLRGCAQCHEHEPLLEVRLTAGLDKKPETKKVFATLLSPSDARELRKAGVKAAKAG
jgi:hypothetical protein